MTGRLSPRAARASLHVAVALFGFAGLFGKWLALSPRRRSCSAARRSPRCALAALLRCCAASARRRLDRAPGRQRRDAGAALGQRSSPAIQVSTCRGRPARLRELSAVRAAARARAVCAALRRREARDRGAGVRRARVARARIRRWSSRVVRGPRVGHRVRLHVRAARRAQPRARSSAWRQPTSRSGRTCSPRCALLPIVAFGGAVAAVHDARTSAAARARRCVHGARAHAVHRQPARVSAHTASVVAALEPVYGIALAAAAAGRDSGGAHARWAAR